MDSIKSFQLVNCKQISFFIYKNGISIIGLKRFEGLLFLMVFDNKHFMVPMLMFNFPSFKKHVTACDAIESRKHSNFELTYLLMNNFTVCLRTEQLGYNNLKACLNTLMAG